MFTLGQEHIMEEASKPQPIMFTGGAVPVLNKKGEFIILPIGDRFKHINLPSTWDYVLYYYRKLEFLKGIKTKEGLGPYAKSLPASSWFYSALSLLSSTFDLKK